ncbi:hypothetical protein CAOG_03754 [Capsaspora owczarzaki ATCC 30864]|uniref:Uncharacterized protein n=1 Tax=Capsaspora owczarzaki (strain ATCC 30864) TaxID=595528 RepID=A0A0D2WPX2_CAPO3|nr:hypothetical protein CAOG_03754 [Capsaspora owczarzaki ATCC 30864]KJE92863.1 hypothetical protein CAOG_003754 [Capsaspora owczarzaki ATCC 30864]|eukprot:XP_004363482.1 hypothetical protein CAOG_03754 [Capsaspora owczarzaki ATCC 30864]
MSDDESQSEPPAIADSSSSSEAAAQVTVHSPSAAVLDAFAGALSDSSTTVSGHHLLDAGATTPTAALDDHPDSMLVSDDDRADSSAPGSAGIPHTGSSSSVTAAAAAAAVAAAGGGLGSELSADQQPQQNESLRLLADPTTAVSLDTTLPLDDDMSRSNRLSMLPLGGEDQGVASSSLADVDPVAGASRAQQAEPVEDAPHQHVHGHLHHHSHADAGLQSPDGHVIPPILIQAGMDDENVTIVSASDVAPAVSSSADGGGGLLVSQSDSSTVSGSSGLALMASSSDAALTDAVVAAAAAEGADSMALRQQLQNDESVDQFEAPTTNDLGLAVEPELVLAEEQDAEAALAGENAPSLPPSGLDPSSSAGQGATPAAASAVAAADLSDTIRKSPSDPAAAAADAALPSSVESAAAAATSVEADGSIATEWTLNPDEHVNSLEIAWYVPEPTRSVLATVRATGDREQAPKLPVMKSSPCIVIDELQTDPVRELLVRHFDEAQAAKRKTLTADDVPLDRQGICQLMAAGCWNALLDLTGSFLSAHGQGRLDQDASVITAVHTHKTLQMWLCRMIALMKLRRYEKAAAELDTFGDLDRPDLYYDYYPDSYPDMTGSLVPFSLRVIHAQLPHYVGKPQLALDRLYSLNHTCTQVMSHLRSGKNENGIAQKLAASRVQAALTLWGERQTKLQYCIANHLLMMKDHTLGTQMYEHLLSKNPTNNHLLSGLGRVHLQIGHIERAQSYFARAEQVAQERSGDVIDAATASLLAMNKALTSVSTGLYEQATAFFAEALLADPNNATAANNQATCMLYAGNLKKAVKLLEDFVMANPRTRLHESIVFNLCTLYELESNRAMEKKRRLIQLIAEHCGDGFDVSSLKLTVTA